ncbi:MAG: hypothetical protein Q4B06_01070 [Candidatus Saccharibacteria bacterium]|nr:hypothetical protein [Candidatus Saccharibacteria bacterium]
MAIEHNRQLHHHEQEVSHERQLSPDFTERHAVAKQAIAHELHIAPDSPEAEQVTGDYFVDKVDYDIATGASLQDTIADTEVALFSGINQLDASAASQGKVEGLTPYNPISQLEWSHPTTVASTVKELGAVKRTSAYAAFVAKVARKVHQFSDTARRKTLGVTNAFATKLFKQPSPELPAVYPVYKEDATDHLKYAEWKTVAGTKEPMGQYGYDTVEDEKLFINMPYLGPPGEAIHASDAWHEPIENISDIPSLPESSVQLNPKEIVQSLEMNRAAKQAPRLAEQLQDGNRTNMLTYLAHQATPKFSATSEVSKHSRHDMSEQASLQGLYDFMELRAIVKDEACANKLQDIHENLTFIGEKEYQEAAKGIAEYWKGLLAENKNLQLCVIAGEIAKAPEYQDSATGTAQIKSDEYLLNTILQEFSDEERDAYEDRLVLHEDDITATPEDTRVILLDDWTLSGSQLAHVYVELLLRKPELAHAIEAQLIVASQDRVENGLTLYDPVTCGEETLPIRAYYQAHNAEHSHLGAYITGFHSSTDYDFETVLGNAVQDLHQQGYNAVDMPPATNIVRPYRAEGVTRESLHNIQRFRAHNAMSQ